MTKKPYDPRELTAMGFFIFGLAALAMASVMFLWCL